MTNACGRKVGLFVTVAMCLVMSFLYFASLRTQQETAVGTEISSQEDQIKKLTEAVLLLKQQRRLSQESDKPQKEQQRAAPAKKESSVGKMSSSMKHGVNRGNAEKVKQPVSLTDKEKVPTVNPILERLRAEGAVELPSKEILKTMSEDSIFRTYHSYLDNTDFVCHRKLRMGNMDDGGWEICDDEPYRPKLPCLVYSFGINNDFSFDDYTTKVYQCKVFSFDPSMRKKSQQRTPLNYFLRIGIDGKNFVNKRNWTMQTLHRMKEMLNHTEKIIDVLKMDVESSEWSALPQMIESGEMRRVRQFLVEYHGADMKYQHMAILKDLYDLGFRKFYVHKNPACKKGDNRFPVMWTRCYEVHYVNINCARKI